MAYGRDPDDLEKRDLDARLSIEPPELLPKAQAAARADDDAPMTKYVLECLRFNSFAAGIACVRDDDYVVARGTL